MEPQPLDDDPQPPPEPPSPLINVVIEDTLWQTMLGNPEDAATDTARRVLASSDYPLAEVTILLTDDQQIESLNASFRGLNKPTNVLSFPFEDHPGGETEQDSGTYLGDLALASGVVRREAIDQAKSTSDHFNHMIVHGLLHLLGYDHEDDESAEAMEALEIHLLSEMQIANPYEGAVS